MWLVWAGLWTILLQSYSLIETHQLLALMRQAKPLHILEVCGVSEVDTLGQPHIPGSHRISLKDLSDLSMWPILKTPRQQDFIQLMKTYGIKKDATEIVLYDRSGVLYSAKAWWVLTVFGKRNVVVLNGGLPKWMREGYATTLTLSTPSVPLSLQLDSDYLYQLDLSRTWTVRELIALVEAFQAQTPTPPIQLIDVRPKADFDLNHVQGSQNLPIEIARRADGTLRSAVELELIFQMYSVRTTNETLTVVIGMNGVDSSTALLSLAVVGSSHSAMVDGGWVEYRNWLRATPTSVYQVEVPAGSEYGWRVVVWGVVGAVAVCVGLKSLRTK